MSCDHLSYLKLTKLEMPIGIPLVYTRVIFMEPTSTERENISLQAP